MRQRLRSELASFWDTDVAILCGLAAALLGIFQVTDLETTVALTLVVLAALAGSLHRDRSLREGLRRSVDDLDARLSTVSRAYSNPLPYDVISAWYQWQFDDTGEIAKVRKQARVRFVHNGVWSILSWHMQGVRANNPAAHRRLEGGKTHPLKVFGDLNLGDGKVGKLIGLDDEYGQNQVLDFEYAYESQGNFRDAEEWLNVAIETFTADITIEIVWPTDRRPSKVFLSENGEQRDLPIDARKAGHVTTFERQNLVAGENLAIRWRWLSSAQLQQSEHQEADELMGERTGQ